MKPSHLPKLIDEVVDIKLKAVDAFIEEVIEPLEQLGNPEELIGKPYEQWTPEDLQRLTFAYGTKEPNPLSNLVFRRALERVQRLEAEEV